MNQPAQYKSEVKREPGVRGIARGVKKGQLTAK
jgi:hypothetical protein